MTLETAKASIRPGQTVRFKPVWAGRKVSDIQYKQGKVVQVYEHIFRVKAKHTYEVIKW